METIWLQYTAGIDNLSFVLTRVEEKGYAVRFVIPLSSETFLVLASKQGEGEDELVVPHIGSSLPWEE